MKPGELTASGVLFLRSPPYTAKLPTGRPQYLLPLLERRGLGVQHVTAIWQGDEAEAFMAAHGDTLRAGRPLSLSFSRLSCHNNELHGVVHSCALAPQRWAAPVAATAAPADAPTAAASSAPAHASAATHAAQPC